jgi:hypothetical protein
MSEATQTLQTESSAAGRMRLHRKRRREGLRYVRVLLPAGTIDALVDRVYLLPDERDNDAALQRAIGELVAITLDLDLNYYV